MAYTVVSFAEFTENQYKHSDDYDLTMNGYSPGYVSSKLGIQRHSVHMAIQRGSLEAFRVERDEGRLMAIFIPQRAIDAYRANHLNWAGQRKTG